MIMANERARRLRKTMTPQEVKLWAHLRSWKSRGYHFRRQAPRDGFILDFVCLRRRIIIEVDGDLHGFQGNATRDRLRDQHFQKQGFSVIRFWNNDIDSNLDGVLQTINVLLQSSRFPTPALRADPPPLGEG